jgi:hypothetical protein
MDNLVRDDISKGYLPMKAFAKFTALIGLAGIFAGTALAKAPAPPAAPPATSAGTTAKSGTMVKAHSRTLKSGKVVSVKGYTRKPKTTMTTPKTVAVKGYTRTTKTGKVITVKGYTRKPATKSTKPAVSKTAAPKTM